MLNLMKTAYAIKLMAEAKETDEQKKIRQITNVVTSAYRIFQDELVNAIRKYEDSKTKFERILEDVTKEKILLNEEKEAIHNGKFGVNFVGGKDALFNIENKLEKIEDQIRSFESNFKITEYYLQFIKNQGNMLGFTV